MRIVIFSDSHNNPYALKSVIKRQPDARYYIHLGDGEQDYEAVREMCPGKTILFVAGNCDWYSQYPDMGLLECGGKTIFYTHGHKLGVKGGLDRLKDKAWSVGAHIALFGHVHQAVNFYEDGLYVMCPGSVAKPRDGRPSYGWIDITPEGVVTQIVRI